MTIYTSRPADARLPKEERVYDLLERLHIPFQRADHAAAMTMEACHAVDEALGTAMCKNLLLCNRQRTAFYLLLLPGEKPFRTSSFSKTIGSSRLSFAPGEDMERLLDITPGSLSVLGLMNDRENQVQLVIDREVLREGYVCVHPCVNTSSLKLRTADLLEKLLPAMHHEAVVVEVTA